MKQIETKQVFNGSKKVRIEREHRHYNRRNARRGKVAR